MKLKKILLVRPNFVPIIDCEDYARALPFLKKQAFMPPLELATIAALTPADIQVEIWDESIHGEINTAADVGTTYDLIGVTGYEVHRARVIKISKVLRSLGIPLLVGGPGVSAAPEYYQPHYDILFIGEAEETWPQFISDWETGTYRKEYRQNEKIDITRSPLPVWKNMAQDARLFLVGCVQTTRGCPFDCEFCDVVYIYGHRQRHKTIDQVLDEIRAMERLGFETIFISDDNFYGDPKYYKKLLREIISLNNTLKRPLIFNTQMDMRAAQDDEMLALMADANFNSVLIGLESPNRESLIEVNAQKNLGCELLHSIGKIHSYGLEVIGSVIVGFDSDDKTVFEQQFDFLQQAGIPVLNVNILAAMTGTKLWKRIREEGRLLTYTDVLEDGEIPFVNIQPARMSRLELLSGFLTLVKRTREWPNFEARVKTMIARVQRQPQVRRVRPSFDWARISGILKFLFITLDREARGVLMRLISNTRKRSPFMIPLVMKMFGRNYTKRIQLASIEKYIFSEMQREIEVSEASPDL